MPVGATEQDKHIPILVSADLAVKQRVVVLFPERDQDLGIFSYRTIGNENISEGSAINLVSLVMNGMASRPGQEIPGIVPSLLNLPQGCKFASRCPKVMPMCEEEEPPLEQVAPQHYSACWLNH